MFSIDFTFLWTLVNLLILFFVLKKVLFGRVGAFMEKRAKKIADEHQLAAQERAEAKALLENYNEKLQTAYLEGDAIIKQARKTAEDEAARILAAAREDAAGIVENARRQIQSERQTAVIAFKTQAVSLALAIARRILRRSVNSADERLLAENALNELAGMLGNRQ
ncbi:MAG: F0F1 ATP synthase subunit B [Spirochaetaceae bacterium]|jgi:F-type H+-transporting ATPase subunit b|nr:F0F1 ATP synthase subunit B [Spirochaetaceae bacterium]